MLAGTQSAVEFLQAVIIAVVMDFALELHAQGHAVDAQLGIALGREVAAGIGDDLKSVHDGHAPYRIQAEKTPVVSVSRCPEGVIRP